MKSIPIEFDLKEGVVIKALQCPGVVARVSKGDMGVEYKVCYWFDGKREEVWVFADELEATK